MPRGRKKKIDVSTPEVATPTTSNDKKEKLLKLMNDLNREYKTVILKFAKDEPDKERIPFGIENLDQFTGGGGVTGNYIIIYGGEGTGKSTLALCQVASAQKIGKVCAYIDLEHSFNKERATSFGVDLDNLLLIEEIDNAEQAMDIVIKLSKEKVVDFVVIDSIQAMTPKAENEAKSGKDRAMEEDEIALLAKKMGKFLRRTATPIYKSKVGVTLIGQVRTGGIGTFATHDELTGGRAQKHWSLLTLFLRKGQGVDAPFERKEVEEEDENGKKIKIKVKTGFDCVIKIEKSKVNSKPELSELHTPFYFKTGFHK
jgi:recombination protein RecA